MRAIRGLWRWRHNPLRRGTDLAEAWVALTALLLILCVTPVAGTLVARAADGALQKSVREQRHTRFEVAATVVREVERSPLEASPDLASGRDTRSRVLADWTGPDGSEHHTPVMTTLKSPHHGDHFTIWTDPHGDLAARPLDSATATTHAVLAGIGTALAVGGLIEAVRRLIVWRMVRRRYARLDQAWLRAGPDWGRTGTGS
ncbi:hypothetical protein C3489_22565 [Streptomyces sp. Ru71]|uniref:Rv1733c family protein n=1 Tax=Streptomyces sp. Ru71 TaxID=2080746 RepID=UPI000CDCFDE9|nr:hypothetical protein [Streptomyces sp. Ru71]POX50444.1 hypothetical protein C3489_22565 [Streptomyces sp. Ru71]